MSKEETINCAEIAAHMIKSCDNLDDLRASSPHFIAQHASRLQTIARTLRKMGEDECNIAYTEVQQRKRDFRRTELEAEACGIAHSYNLTVRFQRDPRGPAIYLQYEPDRELAIF